MPADAVMGARARIGDAWVPFVALVELSGAAADDPVEVRGPPDTSRDEAPAPPGVIASNLSTGSITIERRLFDALLAAVRALLDNPPQAKPP